MQTKLDYLEFRQNQDKVDLGHPEDVEKAQWRFNERRTGVRSTREFDVRLNVKEENEKHFDIKYIPIKLYAFGLYGQPISKKL